MQLQQGLQSTLQPVKLMPSAMTLLTTACVYMYTWAVYTWAVQASHSHPLEALSAILSHITCRSSEDTLQHSWQANGIASPLGTALAAVAAEAEMLINAAELFHDPATS